MPNEALRLQRATRKFRDAMAPWIDPIAGERKMLLDAVNNELEETGMRLVDDASLDEKPMTKSVGEPTEAERETARAVLTQCIGGGCDIEDNPHVKRLRIRQVEAIASALALARSEGPRWVPCAKRMPEPNTNVLAIVPGKYSTGVVVTYSPRGKPIDWEGFPNAETTHWMPLPPPPPDAAKGSDG